MAARMISNAQTQQARAVALKKLHIPGNPIVFSNVYDAATAEIIASLPTTKALASASFAVSATVTGVPDAYITQDALMPRLQSIGRIADKHNLPFSVDIEDGRVLDEAIPAIIAAGAVGCNIEDVDLHTKKLRSVEEAVARIKRTLQIAADQGVPDFVINARTDVLFEPSATIDDAIARGKIYLEAGANTVFVWGGPKRGVSTEEVRKLVQGLGGKVNVKMNLKEGALKVKDLKEIGVARISIGPELYKVAMAAVKEAAEKMMIE